MAIIKTVFLNILALVCEVMPSYYVGGVQITFHMCIFLHVTHVFVYDSYQ